MNLTVTIWAEKRGLNFTDLYMDTGSPDGISFLRSIAKEIQERINNYLSRPAASTMMKFRLPARTRTGRFSWSARAAAGPN